MSDQLKKKTAKDLIDKAWKMITDLRIKSMKEIVTEKDLYDVQIELNKAADLIPSPDNTARTAEESEAKQMVIDRLGKSVVFGFGGKIIGEVNANDIVSLMIQFKQQDSKFAEHPIKDLKIKQDSKEVGSLLDCNCPKDYGRDNMLRCPECGGRKWNY